VNWVVIPNYEVPDYRTGAGIIRGVNSLHVIENNEIESYTAESTKYYNSETGECTDLVTFENVKLRKFNTYNGTRTIDTNEPCQPLTYTCNVSGSTLFDHRSFFYIVAADGKYYLREYHQWGFIQSGGGFTSSYYFDTYIDDIPIPVNITNTDPVNNSTGVPLNKVISITFDDSIVAGNSYDNIVLQTGGVVVPIAKSIIGNVLYIAPSLLVVADYTLTLPSNAITTATYSTFSGYVLKFATGLPTSIQCKAMPISQLRNAQGLPFKLIPMKEANPL